MKKGLIIGLTATALAVAVASLVSVGVSAGPLQRNGGDQQATQTLTASEIADIVRAAGLDPDGEPVLRGRYYILRAFDPYGGALRVLADAQFGDILSILPVQRAYRARYGGPRIIHVPQPDDAEVGYRDDIGARDADNDYQPPVQTETSRPRSKAPPRPKRHIVTSAPPPPPQADDKDKALTPVYPTPDFGAKVDGGEKFGPPPRRN